VTGVQTCALPIFLDRDGAGGFRHLDPPLSFSPAAQKELLADLERARELLTLLRRQGRALLSRATPSLKEKFLAVWRRSHQVLDQSPWLGVLGMLWREKIQAVGQDLPPVLEVTERFLSLVRGLEKEIQ
jgi:hypothetical protein